jgi:surface polysaccharide O-acyltransferase-like enzyme
MSPSEALKPVFEHFQVYGCQGSLPYASLITGLSVRYSRSERPRAHLQKGKERPFLCQRREAYVTPERPQRRPDIDWIRALAVLLLVPFHSALIFCHDGIFPLRSGEHSEALSYFAGILTQWHMPLLFVISGAGTWFALQFRGAGQYAKERAQRLLVPLVFGSLVIVPPQVYLQRVSEGRFEGSFLAFYPHFFNGIYPEGNLTWNHLWFVAYLFVFSLLALPVFVRTGGNPGPSWISNLASLSDRRGGIFLLAVPIVLTEAVFRAAFPGVQNLVWDWANFSTYFILFVLGFVILADERFQQAVSRDGPYGLVLGLMTTGIGVGLHLAGVAPGRGYSTGWTAYMVLRGFNMWFWILAVLALGKRFLFFTNRTLGYVSEATYPFYILHMTVVVLVGFPVMKWNLGIGGRYLFVVIASILATIGTYEVLVRRWKVARFLFGMRPRKDRYPEKRSAFDSIN